MPADANIWMDDFAMKPKRVDERVKKFKNDRMPHPGARP